ncbi:MAG: hypothetical protein ACR2PI_12215 [Hyphomicrobiaceae bacterium]
MAEDYELLWQREIPADPETIQLAEEVTVEDRKKMAQAEYEHLWKLIDAHFKFRTEGDMRASKSNEAGIAAMARVLKSDLDRFVDEMAARLRQEARSRQEDLQQLTDEIGQDRLDKIEWTWGDARLVRPPKLDNL